MFIGAKRLGSELAGLTHLLARRYNPRVVLQVSPNGSRLTIFPHQSLQRPQRVTEVTSLGLGRKR
jgi:hypothetical protein